MYYWYVQNPGSSTWTLSKKTSSDQIYTRTFTSQGIYKVRLYVFDNDGEYSTSSETSLNTCTITVVDNNIYAPVVENRLSEVQSDNRVILNSQVVSTGNEAPFVKIYYGTQDGGTTAGNWASVWEPNPQTGQSGTFSSGLLEGFQSASTYYFRCYAWNSAGGDWDDNTNQQTRTYKFKTAPAQASSPIPENTQMVAIDLDPLEWTAGTGATVHKVYFGNTYNTVAQADELSAAYQGQVSTPAIPLPRPWKWEKPIFGASMKSCMMTSTETLFVSGKGKSGRLSLCLMKMKMECGTSGSSNMDSIHQTHRCGRRC
jgi:hypothetical protein